MKYRHLGRDSQRISNNIYFPPALYVLLNSLVSKVFLYRVPQGLQSDSDIKQSVAIYPFNIMTNMNSPWYKPNIGPRLKPVIRRVYETWSGLSGDELIDHLHYIVGTPHFYICGYYAQLIH